MILNKNTIKILRGILQDLKAGNWTQEASARDDKGMPVSPESPTAVCWCLTGSIAKHTFEEGDEYYHSSTEVKRLLARLIKPSFDYNKEYSTFFLINYNDEATRTISDCIDVVEKAIKFASDQSDPDLFFK